MVPVFLCVDFGVGKANKLSHVCLQLIFIDKISKTEKGAKQDD